MASISMAAPTPPDSEHLDGSLWFSCRAHSPASVTKPSESVRSSMETASSSSETAVSHSYPPTPSSSEDPSTYPLDSKPHNSASVHPNPPMHRRSCVIKILLSPHSTASQHAAENQSIFNKALSLLRNHKPSHSASFTLCALFPDTEAASSVDTSVPLVTFHDRTPVFTFHATTGILEINRDLEAALDIDRSFWVAASLAYMDFLRDREVSAWSSGFSASTT